MDEARAFACMRGRHAALGGSEVRRVFADLGQPADVVVPRAALTLGEFGVAHLLAQREARRGQKRRRSGDPSAAPDEDAATPSDQ